MRKIIVNTLDKRSRINRNIYGNFSEHLGGYSDGGRQSEVYTAGVLSGGDNGEIGKQRKYLKGEIII